MRGLFRIIFMLKFLQSFLFFIFIMFCFVNFCFAESYNREKHFGGWIDADGDGQDTRQEVLIRDSVVPVRFDENGNVEWGIWICRYTGNIFTDPSKLQIDHVVALKESWLTGADKWTQERRIEYANYLAAEEHLIAVTAKTNQEKSAKDVSQWLPEINQLAYIIYRIKIKERWGLCFSKAEAEVFEKSFVRTIYNKDICDE